MSKIFQSLIRTSAFLRKEVAEVLRQPRLVLTLVLGPFLILLLFGIGYRNQARSLRTLFVVQPNSPLAQEIKQNASTLGPQLIFEGVTTDEARAMQQLIQGKVDLVAVAPADAFDKIKASQTATFILYHREIDPYQVDYVKYFGQVYIDEVNRRVLMNIVAQGQTEASSVQQDIAAAQQNAAAMKQALQAGNELQAQAYQGALSKNLDSVSLAVGASLGVLSGVQEMLGPGNSSDASTALALLSQVQQDTSSLSSSNSQGTSTDQQIAKLNQVQENLSTLDTSLKEFTSISPEVLVRPFRTETKSIAKVQPTAMDYYAPAVIALLLQHLAITFAALSIVRERTVGTVELFRVSPLSAGETLVGKYLSYIIFGGVLAALLTLLLYFGLRVPMLGSWLYYALVVAILLFTSLGFGFVISLLSETDSQAVQLTMIILLASVFFSGFLLRLDLIWQPVRILSWALPTTYGIQMLQDVFLRGLPPNPLLLGGLAGIGIVLFLVAWLLLRRLISNE
jgi:ABC-2 type transport system permease protein